MMSLGSISVTVHACNLIDAGGQVTFKERCPPILCAGATSPFHCCAAFGKPLAAVMVMRAVWVLVRLVESSG